MFKPENDGIDHINIYSKGKTLLGKFMSNMKSFPMTIDGLNFDSIECYWYWLSTGEKYDNLRTMSSFAAKAFGKNLPKVQRDDFEALIKRALRLKVVLARPAFEKDLKESTLPFAHYYTFGENPPVVRDAGFKWIVEEWEKIRKELKEINK
jgi:predicted NAD-dependent protein-ADP-ribosyltransferase YbiA (DUF1768 family)